MQHKTIHILKSGAPVCGFTKDPLYLWDKSNTSTLDPRNANCENCKKNLGEQQTDKKGLAK
jgi:hypothetical protein